MVVGCSANRCILSILNTFSVVSSSILLSYLFASSPSDSDWRKKFGITYYSLLIIFCLVFLTPQGKESIPTLVFVLGLSIFMIVFLSGSNYSECTIDVAKIIVIITFSISSIYLLILSTPLFCKFFEETC